LNEVSYIFAILSYTTLVKELPIFTVSLAFPSPKVYPKVHSFTFASLSEAFIHVIHLHRSFIEKSHNALCVNISNFLRKLKILETQVHYESLSNSLDDALMRKASICRTRPNEITDAKNALTAVGTCFAHTALDYVAQINIAHAHKDHLILDGLWSFIKECSSFFTRGHSFFDEWTAMESGPICETVAVLADKSKTIERKMQDRHALVPKEVFLHPAGISPDEDVIMEGYLFKRATNAFKTWHRRWFQIKDNKLIYSHRSVAMETPTVMEPDLKLCLVRSAPPSVDRASCFELITPSKFHLLQADSDALCNAWIRALQRTIHHLHEVDDNLDNFKPAISSVSDSSTLTNCFRDTLLTELWQIPGNEKCADCGAKAPKWASINLGALICIECCGIHRSFGVQVSKVRSLTMDSLEPEQRKLMLALGNRVVNSVYLAHLPESNIVPPPSKPTSSRPAREAWIKAKYIEKRFVRKSSERVRNFAHLRAEGCFLRARDDDGDGIRVLEAAKSGNITSLIRLIAEGVDINSTFANTTALHAVLKNGDCVMVEFLLLNGAKVNALDASLNTPLHLASSLGHTLIVCQLMKRGADQRLCNHAGETPLDVAVEKKHADIVTLLRLQQMRNEFRDEFNNPMDETVDDIMLDISRRKTKIYF
uniref:Arf-GAP with coiled-coil, ANK repeat and PH domain-containing protein 2 n=1 Tax=Dracunculus medinensis TaxID=318479 RepID=A0A0N4UAS0_DRAME